MRIVSIYFSPTGGVEQAVQAFGQALQEQLGGSVAWLQHNFTLPNGREEAPLIAPDDWVIVGVPVYAGRVPNLMLPFLNTLRGNGAKVIPVVTYGNRAYDQALLELSQLMVQQQFQLVGAAALVSRHAFSDLLAGDRPHVADRAALKAFAHAVVERWQEESNAPLSNYSPLRELTDSFGAPLHYYQPTDVVGNAIDLRKVKPITTDACRQCGWCAQQCPMGAISTHDPQQVTGICIKCCRCVRGCPAGAKAFVDEGYRYHVQDLEQRYGEMVRENEFYL